MQGMSIISMDNPDLAKAELEAVFPECTVTSIIDHVALFTADKSDVTELQNRLAYTHAIYELCVHTQTYKLLDELKKVPWQQWYKGSFYVTVDKKHRTSPITTQDVANAIATTLDNPKADSVNPSMHVHIVLTEKTAVAGVLLHTNDKAYEKRRPHMRPAVHPSSIHPKLARALINLSGIHKGTMLDPFCGVGGVLIEAGLMGMYVKGIDIDPVMIEKTQTNLEHYGIKNYTVLVGDARTTQETADVIITDVPYGKNTKDISPTLYEEFLEHASTLTKKMVIVFEKADQARKIIEKTPWSIQAQHQYYVHKDMTKAIFVLRKS